MMKGNAAKTLQERELELEAAQFNLAECAAVFLFEHLTIATPDTEALDAASRRCRRAEENLRKAQSRARRS